MVPTTRTPRTDSPTSAFSGLSTPTCSEILQQPCLHRAQHDVGVLGPADDQAGMPGADIFFQHLVHAVEPQQRARRAQRKALNDPVKDQGGLAEIIAADQVLGYQRIVDDQQDGGQDADSLGDSPQIQDRRETPPRLVQPRPPVNEPGDGHPHRQEGQHGPIRPYELRAQKRNARAAITATTVATRSWRMTNAFFTRSRRRVAKSLI